MGTPVGPSVYQGPMSIQGSPKTGATASLGFGFPAQGSVQFRPSPDPDTAAVSDFPLVSP